MKPCQPDCPNQYYKSPEENCTKKCEPYQEWKQAEKKRKRAEKKEHNENPAVKRGKKSKRKGYRGENELTKKLSKFIPARRVPLSGALGGDLAGDVVIDYPNRKVKAEVKLRNSVPITVYKWLQQGEADLLFMRRDNMPWLVCMTLEEFIRHLPEREEEE